MPPPSHIQINVKIPLSSYFVCYCFISFYLTVWRNSQPWSKGVVPRQEAGSDAVAAVPLLLLHSPSQLTHLS